MFILFCIFYQSLFHVEILGSYDDIVSDGMNGMEQNGILQLGANVLVRIRCHVLAGVIRLVEAGTTDRLTHMTLLWSYIRRSVRLDFGEYRRRKDSIKSSKSSFPFI